MTAPQRVKVAGDLFHGRVPDGAVYVGRQAPGLRRSRFANPYRVQDLRSATEAVRMFRDDLLAGHLAVTVADVRAELAGRDLACWCKPGQPCHADALLQLANGGAR